MLEFHVGRISKLGSSVCTDVVSSFLFLLQVESTVHVLLYKGNVGRSISSLQQLGSYHMYNIISVTKLVITILFVTYMHRNMDYPTKCDTRIQF